MHIAQMKAVLDRYEKEFARRGIKSSTLPNEVRRPTEAEILAHCAGMIPSMREFLDGDESDFAKFNRWLGWMQGVLCAHGIYTLGEERDHNRPPPR